MAKLRFVLRKSCQFSMLIQTAVLYIALRQLFHKESIGSQHASIYMDHPVALMWQFKYEEVTFIIVFI